MIKQSIEVHEFVEFLNELLALDPETINSLFKLRVICGKELAEHPIVQALSLPNHGVYSVGIIGILNGAFGVDNNNWGCIAMDIIGGKIMKFKILEDTLSNNDKNIKPNCPAGLVGECPEGNDKDLPIDDK